MFERPTGARTISAAKRKGGCSVICVVEPSTTKLNNVDALVAS